MGTSSKSTYYCKCKYLFAVAAVVLGSCLIILFDFNAIFWSSSSSSSSKRTTVLGTGNGGNGPLKIRLRSRSSGNHNDNKNRTSSITGTTDAKKNNSNEDDSIVFTQQVEKTTTTTTSSSANKNDDTFIHDNHDDEGEEDEDKNDGQTQQQQQAPTVVVTPPPPPPVVKTKTAMEIIREYRNTVTNCSTVLNPFHHYEQVVLVNNNNNNNKGPSTDHQQQQQQQQQQQEHDFYYEKGISAEGMKRMHNIITTPQVGSTSSLGSNNNNYKQLDQDYWLEIIDKRHRYGAGLRLYYKHWLNITILATGNINNNNNNESTTMLGDFFHWLDYSDPLPDLGNEFCNRTHLDMQEVDYPSSPADDKNSSSRYALSIKADEHGRAILYDVNGEPLITGDCDDATDVNAKRWIYILRDNRLYGHPKTKIPGHYFQHTSFFGGHPVQCAGHFKTNNLGQLTYISSTSGHYKPGKLEFHNLLYFLGHTNGINLQTITARIYPFPDIKASSAACYLNNHLARKGGKCRDTCE